MTHLEPYQIINYLHNRDDYYYHGMYKKGTCFFFKKNDTWYELAINMRNNQFISASIETCGDMVTPSKIISTTKSYSRLLKLFEKNFINNLDISK